MRKLLLLRLIILFFIVSCEQKANKETAGNYFYELEIVDSLMIDYLGDMQLLSVDSENDLFLYMGNEYNHLMLINRNGDLVSEYKKPVDAPDSFGNIPLGGSIYKGNIAVLGFRKLFIYDLDFNFSHSIERINLGTFGMVYLGYEHLQPYESEGKVNYISYSSGPQTTYESNHPNYYLEYNNLDYIDTEKKTFDPIINFHEKSHFFKSKTAFDRIKPWFQVIGDEVHFVHNIDSMYYRYNLKNPNEYAAEQIPFDAFILTKGYEMGGEDNSNTPKDRPGNVSNLFHHNGQSLILYRSGLKQEQIPEKTDDNQENWRRILEKDKLKLIVRENDGTYSTPFPIPSLYTIQVMDKKGRIWVKYNSFFMDYEPDMVTYYEMKLVKKQRFEK